MRALAFSALLLSLSACTPDEHQIADTERAAFVCESDTCVAAGEHNFTVDGTARRLKVWMPEDAVGAPVIFAWHHLNGSPEELLSYFAMNEAAEQGFVVVVPESRGLPSSEWDVQDPTATNPDIALFDALVDTLVNDTGVDPDRLYATGFSAGGLFTTFLTMHRGADLAATAPFSGGAPAWAYTSPDSTLPVMVSWGGQSDTYGGFDFDDASTNLVTRLHNDGHTVLACEHSLGHWLPTDATRRTLDFFATHAASGDVADFAGCDRLD